MCCGTQCGQVALLLPCLHNICDDCLKQLVHKYQEQGTPERKGKSPHSLTCFLCQTAFVVPPLSGPGCLVNNLILTREWLVQRLAVGQKDHDVNGKPRCDECDTDVDDDIISIVCFDCGSFLCADHANIHRKSRSTARHTVSKVEDGCATSFAVFQSSRAQLQPTPCPNHRKEICTFYCKTCREGFCKICKVRHKGVAECYHAVHALDDKYVSWLEHDSLHNLTPLLEKRKSEVDEQLDELTASERAINTHAEKLSEEITEFIERERAAVIAKLDVQEKQLLDEVDKVRWADLRKITAAKAPLEQVNGKLRQALMLGGKLACIAGQAERSSLCLSWSDSASHILTTAAAAADPVQSCNSLACVEWAKSFDVLADPAVPRGHIRTVPGLHALNPSSIASVSSVCSPSKCAGAVCVSSSTHELRCAIGKTYESLKGYLSVKVNIELSGVHQIPQGGISVQKQVIRSTKRGGKFQTFSESATLGVKNTGKSCKTACLDFDVPLVGGTYNLIAREVSLCHRLVLPRCPFLFDQCSLCNVTVYGDKRGIRVADNSRYGAVVGPHLFAGHNVLQWSVLYTGGQGELKSSVGIVQSSSEKADVSLDWKKNNSAVLFGEEGEVKFADPHCVSISSKKKFCDGSPIPHWRDGSLLRLVVNKSKGRRKSDPELPVDVTVGLRHEDLASQQSMCGEISVSCSSAKIQPYFCLAPGSMFQLLPPF